MQSLHQYPTVMPISHLNFKIFLGTSSCECTPSMSEYEQISIQLLQELVNGTNKIIALLEGRTLSELDDPENWLTSEQALKISEVCVRTLYTLRKEGEILARKKGGRYRYFKKDIFRVRNYHLK